LPMTLAEIDRRSYGDTRIVIARHAR
jgi:uncharacterized protein YaeQ